MRTQHKARTHAIARMPAHDRRSKPSTRGLLVALGAIVLVALVGGATRANGHATVYVINGKPGVKVDVCVGNREIASAVRYARPKGPKSVQPGTYKVRFRAARRARCTGKVYASRELTFSAGGNDTLVLWRPLKKNVIKRFANDLTLPASGSTLGINHTATMGKADLYAWQAIKPASDHFFDPTWDALGRGQSTTVVALPEGQTRVEAFPDRRGAAWSYIPLWFYLHDGTVNQLYLVGNKRANYRLVGVGQGGTPAP